MWFITAFIIYVRQIFEQLRTVEYVVEILLVRLTRDRKNQLSQQKKRELNKEESHYSLPFRKIIIREINYLN